MRGAGFCFCSFIFSNSIVQQLFKVQHRCRRSWTGALNRDRHVRRRLLHIEPLEVRALMSADAFVSCVSPVWFANYETTSTLQHADSAVLTASSLSEGEPASSTSEAQSNVYDWIVQFNTQAVENISTVAQVSSLLTGGGIDFQVLSGLGLVGQVLVRSSGESADVVNQWLADNMNVADFEQDSLRQFQVLPNDPAYYQEYGLSSINAPAAWNLTTGSHSVVVGVVDTGIDYTHVDLAANIWTNPGEIPQNGIDDDGDGFVDDVHGFDFVNNDGNPMDDNGHGTHVSGIIAATGNNSLGITGVNWGVSLMALKFLDSSGAGYVSDAIRAVNYATMMKSRYGVNVCALNNSWGGGGYSSALAAAIEASNNANILFVAAAGNSGTNTDLSAQYPAGYNSANVISVAASDRNDQLASFSCYGATTVDLAAPGVSIYSTVPNNRFAMYSGTSMATPYVTGVAALAWAYKPDATVSEVRSAILQGVDKIASLSGKVASGGRLNAYNTLKLLDANDAPAAPILGAFTVNPSSVVQGSSATLLAQSAANSPSVSAVYFYRDSNGNGVYDSADALVGSDSTIVNSTAQITLSTSTLAAGTYRYFARAVNSNNQWSSPLSATVMVLAADDYGNSAATATLVGANSQTAGKINTGGDVDWFKFHAVAGKQYTISTVLTGLTDSTLTLYDRDGTTQLAYNNDNGTSKASYIRWRASADGTYYIKVSAANSSLTGAYKLVLSSVNTPPTLAPIADQIMSSRADALTVTIPAADADNDPLTYTATAYTFDRLAQKAYQLDQQLGLFQFWGSYWTNIHGAGEKNLFSSSLANYFITPNGGLYRWGGSLASSTLVYSFNASYYANPQLLFNAQPSSLVVLSGGSVSLSVEGNQLIIDPAAGFKGDFYVKLTVSDGAASASRSFKVTVSETNSAPTLQPIADQSMSNSTDKLAIPLVARDADSDKLTYSATAN
ncbi:MAG: S8 family serine peptidase, partial [Thermoguttaceae bacterium]